MKYGGIQTVQLHDTGLIIIHEEKFHETRTVVHETRYTEPILIKDTNEALSHFLKLLDKHNDGEITDFGMRCITDKQGKLIRAEKHWTIPDLQ